MTAYRIALVVEGMERDNGDVRLEVFLSELQKLQGALAKLDAHISDGVRSSYFAVVGLSHSSPAEVQVELRVKPKQRDVRSQVLQHFRRAVESVESGQIPDDIDYGLLENLRELASPVGRDLKAVSIKFDGRAFDFTEAFAMRAGAHLADVDVCAGTIEGMLEKINVHAGANVFTVYPDVGPKSVRCVFGPDQEDAALAAIKNRVSVTGLLHYRKKSAFPHHIDVEKIQIYKNPDDLPSFEDLRGIAPDATGNLASEDFVRELRNAWH